MTGPGTHAEPRYFAVGGTLDTGTTYWRRSSRNTLVAWPPGTWYGPRLLVADVPTDLDPDQRRDHVLGWYAERVTPWLSSVYAEVGANPVRAAALFVLTTRRCCVCGSRIMDDASRLAGACAGCRPRLGVDVLTRLVNAATTSVGTVTDQPQWPRGVGTSRYLRSRDRPT